jgi:uncharacterized membrane-anchored protein
MGACLALILIATFLLDHYVPTLYWLAVVLMSIEGTLITDVLHDVGGVSVCAYVCMDECIASMCCSWTGRSRVRTTCARGCCGVVTAVRWVGGWYTGVGIALWIEVIVFSFLMAVTFYGWYKDQGTLDIHRCALCMSLPWPFLDPEAGRVTIDMPTTHTPPPLPPSNTHPPTA